VDASQVLCVRLLCPGKKMAGVRPVEGGVTALCWPGAPVGNTGAAVSAVSEIATLQWLAV
jgi:hypothetical protein